MRAFLARHGTAYQGDRRQEQCDDLLELAAWHGRVDIVRHGRRVQTACRTIPSHQRRTIAASAKYVATGVSVLRGCRATLAASHFTYQCSCPPPSWALTTLKSRQSVDATECVDWMSSARRPTSDGSTPLAATWTCWSSSMSRLAPVQVPRIAILGCSRISRHCSAARSSWSSNAPSAIPRFVAGRCSQGSARRASAAIAFAAVAGSHRCSTRTRLRGGVVADRRDAGVLRGLHRARGALIPLAGVRRRPAAVAGTSTAPGDCY